MSEEHYQSILNTIRNNKYLYYTIIILSKCLPIIIGLFYAYTIHFHFNIKIIILPALSFITTTIIRNKINSKRPFEVYDIIPLVKHGNGKSFPSRHTTSAFAIAFAVCYGGEFGLIVLLLAFLVAISRILCGVHFIKDILSGLIISIIFSVFYVL